MNAIESVEREVDKVLSQFTSWDNHTQQTLDDSINQLLSLRQELASLNQNETELTEIQRMILNQNVQKIKDILQQISSEHKDLHSAVSKIGKQIDKNFYSEFQCIANEQQFFINLNETYQKEESSLDNNDESALDLEETDNEKKPIKTSKQLELINKVILQHLLRVGNDDVALELVREANLNVDETVEWPFNELNGIVDALKKNNLEPALRWAIENEAKLNERNSLLLFKLHKMKFVQMLKQVDRLIAANRSGEPMVIDNDDVKQSESLFQIPFGTNVPKMQQSLIGYARTHLQRFSQRHGKEIQQLMCCLMYLPNGLQHSPYKSLFSDPTGSEIIDLFTREACSLLGLSVESPLTVTFNAGCVALPALLNIRHLMRQKQVSGVWSCKDELPIVFDLGREGQFHSVFACPILREQAKESNPPMKLVCGHVISRDALIKLTNGTKVKCPYCPVEQNPLDARQIYF